MRIPGLQKRRPEDAMHAVSPTSTLNAGQSAVTEAFTAIDGISRQEASRLRLSKDGSHSPGARKPPSLNPKRQAAVDELYQHSEQFVSVHQAKFNERQFSRAGLDPREEEERRIVYEKSVMRGARNANDLYLRPEASSPSTDGGLPHIPGTTPKHAASTAEGSRDGFAAYGELERRMQDRSPGPRLSGGGRGSGGGGGAIPPGGSGSQQPLSVAESRFAKDRSPRARTDNTNLPNTGTGVKFSVTAGGGSPKRDKARMSASEVDALHQQHLQETEDAKKQSWFTEHLAGLEQEKTEREKRAEARRLREMELEEQRAGNFGNPDDPNYINPILLEDPDVNLDIDRSAYLERMNLAADFAPSRPKKKHVSRAAKEQLRGIVDLPESERDTDSEEESGENAEEDNDGSPAAISPNKKKFGRDISEETKQRIVDFKAGAIFEADGRSQAQRQQQEYKESHSPSRVRVNEGLGETKSVGVKPKIVAIGSLSSFDYITDASFIKIAAKKLLFEWVKRARKSLTWRRNEMFAEEQESVKKKGGLGGVLTVNDEFYFCSFSRSVVLACKAIFGDTYPYRSCFLCR